MKMEGVDVVNSFSVVDGEEELKRILLKPYEAQTGSRLAFELMKIKSSFESFVRGQESAAVERSARIVAEGSVVVTGREVIGEPGFVIADHLRVICFSESCRLLYVPLPMGEPSFVRILGIGKCGIVELFDCGSFGKVAVKRTKDPVNEFSRSTLYREAEALRSFSSPFVLSIIGIIPDNMLSNNIESLVLEYAPNGNLLQLLTAQGSTFNGSHHRFFAASILSALDHIHSKGFLYRDLKAENVLIDEMGYVRISDFGFARRMISSEEKAYTVCGTLDYMSPELIMGSGYDYKSDMWAYGCLLYEICNGYNPFNNHFLVNDEETKHTSSSLVLLKKTSSSDFDSLLCDRIRSGDIPVSEKWNDKMAIDLTLKFLERNVSARYDSKQAFGHPFFDNMNWDALNNLKLPAPWLPRRMSD